MFWEKSYSQSQNIENLLQKEDVTVEELLDDEDILQECKLQTRRLMQFLTRPDVIKRLITLTITEPPENLSVAERFKYSNTACEILTFGLPSLDQKLVENTEILQTLYSFLENEPPLNPLLAAFFSKTFSMLISKKSEQDWFLYQKMCLQLLEFIKSRGNFLDLIFKHFATPVIMDLLLQIIKEVQGGTLKKNLYEWLTEQKLVERVIRILGNPEEHEKHTNVAEFLVDLIKHGRSMRQSDREDSLEQPFTGTDPLLQSLEDEESISLLLDMMLKGEPKESSIVAGISIVLTLVDESIVDEPASDKALKKMIDKERENHERVVSTVIHIIAPRIQEFHHLLLEPPTKNYSIRPTQSFGLTRLEICRLLTVLIQTGNEKIINAICETEYFNTLLKLFKQYSWNNFLHSEVDKCLGYVFACSDQNDNEKNVETNLTALQKHVIINCKIISKLVDCWEHNTETQASQNGRRLGYMGHLIQILKNVSLCVSKYDELGALIQSTLNEEEWASWKSLTDPENGELSNELLKQTRLLADCDPKALNCDNIIADLGNLDVNNIISHMDTNMEMNYSDGIDDQGSPLGEPPLSKFYDYLDNDNVISCLLSSSGEISANLRQLKVWGANLSENLDDDMDLERFSMDSTKPEISSLNMTINPWGQDPFAESGTSGNDVGGWADFSSNNFADFDAHFSSFRNDFGDKYEPDQDTTQQPEPQTEFKILIEKSDNNANVEKVPIETMSEQQTELQNKNAKNIDLQNAGNESVPPMSSTTGNDYDNEALKTSMYNGDEVNLGEHEHKTSEELKQASEATNEDNNPVISNGPASTILHGEGDSSGDEKSSESHTEKNSTNVDQATKIIEEVQSPPAKPPTTTTVSSSSESAIESKTTGISTTVTTDNETSENGPI